MPGDSGGGQDRLRWGRDGRTSSMLLPGKDYQSDVPYDELKSYYIEQLKPLGWRLIAEKSVKDWWRDLGGRELTFQRGDYLLIIEFAEEKADYGWNYAISITS